MELTCPVHTITLAADQTFPRCRWCSCMAGAYSILACMSETAEAHAPSMLPICVQQAVLGSNMPNKSIHHVVDILLSDSLTWWRSAHAWWWTAHVARRGHAHPGRGPHAHAHTWWAWGPLRHAHSWRARGTSRPWRVLCALGTLKELNVVVPHIGLVFVARIVLLAHRCRLMCQVGVAIVTVVARHGYDATTGRAATLLSLGCGSWCVQEGACWADPAMCCTWHTALTCCSCVRFEKPAARRTTGL